MRTLCHVAYNERKEARGGSEKGNGRREKSEQEKGSKEERE